MLSPSFELTVNPARLAYWAGIPIGGLDAPKRLFGTTYEHNEYPVLKPSAGTQLELTRMCQGRNPEVTMEEYRETSGLIPHESLCRVAHYRDSLRHRRCIIPADRLHHLSTLRPCSSMTLASTSVFGLAGIWDVARDYHGSTVHIFAVITTLVIPAIHSVADCMPIVIAEEDRARWLNVNDPEEPYTLLRPLSEKELQDWTLMPGVPLA